MRNGTRDQPDEEEDERADVDWTPSVELSHIIISLFAHPLFQFPMMLVRGLTSDSGLKTIGPMPGRMH